MRILAKVAIALAILSPTVVPTNAHAAIYSDCGGSWTYRASCDFVFAGGSFLVAGVASSPTAPTAVKVTISEPQTGLVLRQCSAYTFDGRSVSCVADTPSLPTDPLAELPLGAVLRCDVTGFQGGSYTCRSFIGY